MSTSLKDYLVSSRHIAIVSHLHPDGDAIGSSLALSLVLKGLGCKVTVVNSSLPLEKRYAFLEGFGAIKNEIPLKCDLLLMVDCSLPKRTGVVFPQGIPMVVIDHHVGASSCSSFDCIDSTACSTAMILYRLFKSWEVPLSKEVATALYVGIVEDTHFFQTRVTSELFGVASDLLSCGVDPSYVARMLLYHESLAKIRLRAIALQRVELLASGSVGMVRLYEEDFSKTGATLYDADGIADEILALATVEIAVMIRYNQGGVKVSIRSKSANVERIASLFGGGGHHHASGFEREYDSLDPQFTKLKEKILYTIQGV